MLPQHEDKLNAAYLASWGALVGVIVLLVITLLVGIGLTNRVQDLEDERASITRWYEDGSGRIKLSNGYCTFPAFDSPEDRVDCVITGGK